ncbi:ribosomal protein L7/L12 [Dactylosporangium sp. CS-047395]|uniref:ribosomal protein L7/L12 n=1 Tax=Dactylosporangium sp. CS-047395 TaxID=3239936 RepID=UPI003D92F080
MDWLAALVFTVIAITGVSLLFGRRGEDPQTARRLATIERKLDLIMDQLGIVEPEPEVDAMVLEELRQGRKIQAIKRYREITGLGLKDAKDEVEALGRRYGLL